jgi:hypothetical protein
MDLIETEFASADSIHMAQNRDQGWVLVNTVLNLQVP